MQRIILTTCGTSLLKSNCWDGINKTKSVIKCETPIREAYERKYRRFTDCYLKKNDVEGLANIFDKNIWSDSSKITWLPAELASLRTIQLYCKKNTPPGPLTKDDKFILLHADNDDAQFCVNVIQKVIESKKLLPSEIERPTWCIEKLDPREPKEFNNALLENLWKKLESKMPFQKEASIEYYLNLTGGYKALGMLLACFGYIRGAAGRVDTLIFYLNEESGEEVFVFNFKPIESDISKKIGLGYIDKTGEIIDSINSIHPIYE